MVQEDDGTVTGDAVNTPDPTELAMTPDEVRAAFAYVTGKLNELGDVDWSALTMFDDTPADCAERALTLQGLAGMLQSIAMSATQTVNDLMTGMVSAALADAEGATS